MPTTTSPTSPKKPKHLGYATVWIPVPLRERIDRALAARTQAAGAGIRPNRQAYIADVLIQHLDATERDVAQP